MGVHRWRRRNGEAVLELASDPPEPRQPPVGFEVPDAPASLVDGSPPVLDTASDASIWGELQSSVAACTRCELHRSRRNTVFGVGSRQASWMIIGEAPGADEDRLGEPFVGRAGKLLDKMLKAIGLSRDAVYITNILKCRPPQNRDPKPDEVECCSGFLTHQIELLAPDIILAVGRISAQSLLRSGDSLGRLRGTVHRFGPKEIPLVVTYHPAYLLREPAEKWKSWEDLKLARRTVFAANRESSP